jgi:hypothetical protein
MTAEFYLMVDLNGLADRIRAAEEARRRRLAKHGRRAIVALVDTQGVGLGVDYRSAGSAGRG